MAQIKAKAPGIVKELKAAVGDTVKAGTVVVVMEAMKMAMPLPSPVDGVIKAIKFETGARVNPGAIIMEIE
ncbi:MAG: Biotin protein MadF [Proteobacteria bacterium]|nr:Biotin protein MadF [Pseudomonadota bacterium]